MNLDSWLVKYWDHLSFWFITCWYLLTAILFINIQKPIGRESINYSVESARSKVTVGKLTSVQIVFPKKSNSWFIHNTFLSVVVRYKTFIAWWSRPCYEKTNPTSTEHCTCNLCRWLWWRKRLPIFRENGSKDKARNPEKFVRGRFDCRSKGDCWRSKNVQSPIDHSR